MNRLLITLILVSQGLLCGAQTSGLDANDVSFLFPLIAGQPYPAISINDEPTLISDILFKQVL